MGPASCAIVGGHSVNTMRGCLCHFLFISFYFIYFTFYLSFFCPYCSSSFLCSFTPSPVSIKSLFTPFPISHNPFSCVFPFFSFFPLYLPFICFFSLFAAVIHFIFASGFSPSTDRHKSPFQIIGIT